MRIKFIVTDTQEGGDLTCIADLGKNKKAFLDIADAVLIKLDAQRTVYLFGEVFYWLDGVKARRVSTAQPSALRKLLLDNRLEDVVYCLEGQYIGFLADGKKHNVTIFGDRYARVDTYYASQDGAFIFANGLDTIIDRVKPVYDQRMLAHFFSVYGWYTPKGFSLYSNISKSRVGEILTVNAAGHGYRIVPFKPLKVEEYGDEALERYYEALKFSIAARVGDGNEKLWVSSSSGWDSSIILGMLVDMYGAKRVGMMTGSMLYSKNTGRINKFEIEKIKKIGAYFGIKPSIVDFDYKLKSSVSDWKKIAPRYRAKQMYSYPAFNFARISDGVAAQDGPGRQVFNGEPSDSIHNFGFSQFCTFFHTEKSFTEYGDKMNCYLYGPAFLKKVLAGTYQKDKVYQIFRKMMPGVNFQDTFNNRKDLLSSYFLPLFYGAPRLPFARTIENPLLKNIAVEQVKNVLNGDVAKGFLEKLDPENIYSWIIHIYFSMHSQGSTVNLHKHAMELNDHRWRSPFNDLRIIELLSKAPESWGRGLNFEHTKYPLKWVAKNKINFPYAILEEGAHSYLYDVIEGFSLIEEITYRSGFTNYFRQLLAERSYRSVLSEDYFDLTYLDKLVDAYLKGNTVKGIDFTNTVSLITLCKTGWY